MIRRAMVRGAPAPAQYISGFSKTNVSGTTEPIDLSAFSVGDLVMVFLSDVTASNPTITGGGAGSWNRDIFQWTVLNYWEAVFWKKLVTGDNVSQTLNGLDTSNNIQVVGYRGASVAAQKATAQSGASDATLSLAGFTKTRGAVRIVSRVSDRDVGVSPSAPAAWAVRQGPFSTGSFFSGVVADAQPAVYSNGAAINWTTFGTTFKQVGVVYELT